MNQQPHAPQVNEVTLESLVEQLTSQAFAGEIPHIDDLVRQYPQHADQLRELLPAIAMMCNWGAAGTASSAAVRKSASADSPKKEPAPRQLGDFRIVREVGRGGMGIVYEAEQISLERRVALKVLPFATVLDDRQLKRFRTEARAAATLKHPNIVSVHSIGCERSIHFYVMDFVDGCSLADVVASRKRELFTAARSIESHGSGPQVTGEPVVDTDPIAKLSTQRSHSQEGVYRSIADLGLQAAEALQYAHEEGVIHRDIKPANLLLDRQGKLHIADFGLARIKTGDDLTLTGDMVGTLRYMSPEQVAGDQRERVDDRTDIYSLGLTLYELITGVPAVQGTSRAETIRQISENQPILPRKRASDVPIDLETIVLRSIAHAPDDRYQSAGDMADDLRRFLQHRSIKARRSGPVERSCRWVRRNPRIAAMTAVILFLLATLAVGSSIMAWRTARNAQLVSAQARKQMLGVYARDMRLVRNAIDEGDLVEAERLLLKWTPDDDSGDERGFEWYHLWSRCHDSSIFHTISHELNAYDVAFSPDGTQLADAFLSDDVLLWDLRADRPKVAMTIPGFAKHAFVARTIVPEGLLLIGDAGGSVAVWDWQAGDIVQRVSVAADDERAWIRSLDKSPTDQLLAIGFVDKAGIGNVHLWDLETEQVAARIGNLPGQPSVGFDASGILLVTSNAGTTLRRYSARAAMLLSEQPLAGTVSAMSVDGQRQRFALCLQQEIHGILETRVEVRDAVTKVDTSQEPLFESNRGGVQALCVAFSPTADEVAIGTADGQLVRVPLQEGQPVSNRIHFGAVMSAKYAPDGSTIVTAGKDGQVHLVHRKAIRRSSPTVTRCEVRQRATGIHVGFVDEGQTVCTTESPDRVYIWNAATGEVKDTITLEEGNWDCIRIGTDPLRQRIAIVRTNWPPQDTPDHVSIWDRRERRFLKETFEIPARVIATTIPFSPDGRYVGLTGPKHVTIIDLQKRDTRRLEFQEVVKACCFSPDGKLIACAPTNGPVHFYDLQTLREARPPLMMDTLSTGCIAFSPQGDLLGSTGFDRRFHLRNVTTGALVQQGELCPRYLATLAFSPDGKRIATGSMDGRVRVWSTESGDELLSIDVAQYYSYVSFSLDGQSLAIASGRDALVVHGCSPQGFSKLSRTELKEIVCRDVTAYGQERRSGTPQ